MRRSLVSTATAGFALAALLTGCTAEGEGEGGGEGGVVEQEGGEGGEGGEEGGDY